MATLDWKKELIDQIDFAWDYHFLERMKGLTDEEYLWEPVPDVWTVHSGDDGGGPTIDPQEHVIPAPFTTIAWRMHHMTDFFTKRWVNHFGDPESDAMDAPVTLSAEEAMANLTFAYGRWKRALEQMPEERLGEPTGMAEGAFYADYPFATLVLHISREFIHHSAECCLIRDLYRQRERVNVTHKG